jgi:hypothetical protein
MKTEIMKQLGDFCAKSAENLSAFPDCQVVLRDLSACLHHETRAESEAWDKLSVALTSTTKSAEHGTIDRVALQALSLMVQAFIESYRASDISRSSFEGFGELASLALEVMTIEPPKSLEWAVDKDWPDAATAWLSRLDEVTVILNPNLSGLIPRIRVWIGTLPDDLREGNLREDVKRAAVSAAFDGPALNDFFLLPQKCASEAHLVGEILESVQKCRKHLGSYLLQKHGVEAIVALRLVEPFNAEQHELINEIEIAATSREASGAIFCVRKPGIRNKTGSLTRALVARYGTFLEPSRTIMSPVAQELNKEKDGADGL